MSACRVSRANFKVPREVRIVSELPRSTLERIANTEFASNSNHSCVANRVGAYLGRRSKLGIPCGIW